MAYFILAVRNAKDLPFEIQFGDHDKQCCQSEREDWLDHCDDNGKKRRQADAKVIKAERSTTSACNAALAALNAKEHAKAVAANPAAYDWPVPADNPATGFRTMDTVPDYVVAKWSEDGKELLSPKDQTKWSSEISPPAIGQVIKINLNRLGEATVKGYFVEQHWLGCRVYLHNAPDWHKRQHGVNPTAWIFGIDIAKA